MSKRATSSKRKSATVVRPSETVLNDKSFLAERWINCNGPEVEVIKQELTRRNWLSLCRKPDSGISSVVREFYGHLNGTFTSSVVRDTQIKFSPALINDLLGVPTVRRSGKHKDEFLRMIDEDATVTGINGHEVLSIIGKSDITWKDEPENLTLTRQKLNTVARFWNLFVCANLLPSSNVNWVPRDRTLMIYALMSGKLIDIGTHVQRILEKPVAIYSFASLYFPCLITSMCRKAGVNTDNDTDLIAPGSVLNATTMRRMMSDDEINNEVPMPGPSSGPPGVLSQADRDYNFYQFAKYTQEWHEAFDKRLAALAKHNKIKETIKTPSFPKFRGYEDYEDEEEDDMDEE